MQKLIAKATLAASIAASTGANATGLPVIDVANLAQTTVSALQSVKTEVYENTNIIYQYKMMANQLLQATGLDADALTEQTSSISDNINDLQTYGAALKDLYGGVSDSADYLHRVQSMVSSSGKTSSQWFQDQASLLASGDKTAKNLFNLGSKVFSNTEALAKRRKQIQEKTNLTPTAQATAQTTNQMLDVLASQNSDVLRLMSTRAQADAAKEQQANAEATEKTEAMKGIVAEQDRQLQQIRSTVYTRDYRNQ
ncbi:hypothetical protein [Cupriavidus basilensis]|uniref:hypothetical protein n=1 Tax=Cupriavidus basilensis TaxID=68895 RepID=UPI00075100E8|nr:hypothetical protein [Cupriavidus basilensis]